MLLFILTVVELNETIWGFQLPYSLPIHLPFPRIWKLCRFGLHLSSHGVFQMMSMEFHCQGRILQHWTSIPHDMAFFWRKNTIFRPLMIKFLAKCPKHQTSAPVPPWETKRYHSQGAANIGLPLGTFVAVPPVGEDRNGGFANVYPLLVEDNHGKWLIKVDAIDDLFFQLPFPIFQKAYTGL